MDLADPMTAAFCNRDTCMSKPHAFNFASESTVCFGITPCVLPDTIGRTTGCRLWYYTNTIN